MGSVRKRSIWCIAGVAEDVGRTRALMGRLPIRVADFKAMFQVH